MVPRSTIRGENTWVGPKKTGDTRLFPKGLLSCSCCWTIPQLYYVVLHWVGMCSTLIPYPAYPSLLRLFQISTISWDVLHPRPTWGGRAHDGSGDAHRRNLPIRLLRLQHAAAGSFVWGCLVSAMDYGGEGLLYLYCSCISQNMSGWWGMNIRIYQNRYRALWGVVLWFHGCQGYCTVPHSTCKTGNCFVAKASSRRAAFARRPSNDLQMSQNRIWFRNI